MAKTLYVMKLGFEAEVDPTNAKEMSAVSEWFAKLAGGEVITAPEGIRLKTEVISAPDISRRKDPKK